MSEDRSIVDLISLAEASSLFGLSADHLRRLVEQNKIWGVKIGRNWATTKSAVEEYVHTRHPRGPKPRNP